MLRNEQVSSVKVNAVDPKEFAYTRMQLMPLVEYALNGDWSNVQELLDSGYSLLWIDPENKKSAIRLIKDACSARDIDGRKIVSKLCEYARAEYGNESESYLFVLLETSDKSVSSYVKLYNSTTGKKCSDYPRDDSFPLTPDSIYYLYMNDKTFRAHDLLKRAYNERNAGNISDDYFEACVFGLMRAAALTNTNIDLIGEMGFCSKAFKNETRSKFVKIAISAAASLYHYTWVGSYIRRAVTENDPMIDVYLGEAIIGAARGGRGDYIVELLETAKKLKVSTTERFLDLLACASGAALVNDHLMLAKTLMLMVPHFNAKPRDIEEMKKWPQHKVERMFATIRDYKMFTDIALHSCLVAGVNTKAWMKALKKEYGLNDMSDEGFDFLIKQPKLVKFLLKYRNLNEDELGNLKLDKEAIKPYLVGNPQINFTDQDFKTFMQALMQAREAGKQPNNHVPLYRMNFFTGPTGPKEYTHYTPDEVRICLEIKEKISSLLDDAIKKRTSKSEAESLNAALVDACSLQDLKNLLEARQDAQTKKKSLLSFKKQSDLLENCIEIYQKGLGGLDVSMKIQYGLRT